MAQGRGGWSFGRPQGTAAALRAQAPDEQPFLRPQGLSAAASGATKRVHAARNAGARGTAREPCTHRVALTLELERRAAARKRSGATPAAVRGGNAGGVTRSLDIDDIIPLSENEATDARPLERLVRRAADASAIALSLSHRPPP